MVTVGIRSWVNVKRPRGIRRWLLLFLLLLLIFLSTSFLFSYHVLPSDDLVIQSQKKVVSPMYHLFFLFLFLILIFLSFF